MKENVAKALRDAHRDTGEEVPRSAVLIVPEGSELDGWVYVCGLQVVVAPTMGDIVLANCPWRLAKAFEDALIYED